MPNRYLGILRIGKNITIEHIPSTEDMTEEEYWNLIKRDSRGEIIYDDWFFTLERALKEVQSDKQKTQEDVKREEEWQRTMEERYLK